MHRPANFAVPWRTILVALSLQALVCIVSNVLAVSTRFPLFNLDVLLLLFGAVGAVAASISIVLGAFVIASEIFGYTHLVFSIPELLNNLPFFPWQIQACVYLGAFAAVSLIVATPLCRRWELRRFAGQGGTPWKALACIGLAFFAAYGAEEVSGWNFFGSTGMTTRWEMRFLAVTLADSDSQRPFVALPPLAGDDALAAAAQHHGDVAVVIVESLGDFKDPAVQQRLDAAFHSAAVLAHYTVSKGLRPFKGSTIHGEFRELCDVELRSLFFASVPEHCMPARFAAMGYRTEAFHGNDAHFYRRATWYPRIGFQDIIDLKKLPDPVHSHCGGIWDAYCDLDVLAFAGRRDAREEPRFTYVLTMNSHLPAHPMTRGVANLPGCRSHYADNICTHLENSQRVLDAIARFAVARAPATILVVGDHAPPFLLDSERELFERASVPYYLLKPI